MEQMAAIGKVINTHGIKGGLKVQMLSDFPERVKKLKRVFLEQNGKSVSFDVLDAFIHGQFWVISLEGITDMDAAGQLVGALMTIPLAERVKLPDDTYYLDQIIGLSAITADGNCLGKVTDVLQTGSNDVYVVRPTGGDAPDILIPALKSVVKRINVKEGSLEVDLPEGLI